MTQADLERHSQALWALFVAYVKEHHLESETAGILILEGRAEKQGQPSLTCVQYAGQAKDAAMVMTRTAMAELHRAGIRLPGGGLKQ